MNRKWLAIGCFSALILTGCGTSGGGGEDWNEVDSGVYWKCIGSDKVYTYYSNGIAVSPNSPEC